MAVLTIPDVSPELQVELLSTRIAYCPGMKKPDFYADLIARGLADLKANPPSASAEVEPEPEVVAPVAKKVAKKVK